MHSTKIVIAIVLVVVGPIGALAQTPICLSQSNDSATLSTGQAWYNLCTNGINWGHAETHWMRSYDPQAMGVTGSIAVQQVTFGAMFFDPVVTVASSTVEIRLYHDPVGGPLISMSGLTLLHTEPFTFMPLAGSLPSLHTVTFATPYVYANSGGNLVVSLYTGSGAGWIYPAGNEAGQTGDMYANVPTTSASIVVCNGGTGQSVALLPPVTIPPTITNWTFILDICYAAPTPPVSDFQCQTGGASMIAAPDCEGWQSLAGSQIIMPNGVTQSCASPGLSQWCEVSPNTLGPASPAVTSATPPVTTFAAGTVSRMQIASTAPTLTAGFYLKLNVKWHWLSGESPASTAYNDFAQITVLPQPVGTPVSAMYVDTFSPLVTATNTCNSGVSNLVYLCATSSPQATSTYMPLSMSGQSVLIDVVAANQGDNGFDSVLWVDDFEWEVTNVAPLLTPTATTQTIGPGCGSLLLASTLPITGSATTIMVSNAPINATTGYLFFGAPAESPLSLLPGCNLYLDAVPLPAYIPLTFQGGTASLPVIIPPGWEGWQVALQAFEPSTPPINLSNGLLLTIGS